jgi:hypothetical protein
LASLSPREAVLISLVFALIGILLFLALISR